MENRLAHGQVVDLITGPYADPPDSWLAAAHSGHARAHLKAAIARGKAEEAAALGRAAVAKAMSVFGGDHGGDPGRHLRDLEDDGTAFSAARRLGFTDLDALYEAVGRDELSAPGFLAHLGIALPQA
jgi:(p)ppGpp synthase/HD superfamily hydrolase